MAQTLCDFTSYCPVFTSTLAQAPHISLRYRQHYCLGEWKACARWALASAVGSERVPVDLLPNQHERADDYLIGVI
ncbi:MAG: hypothetical protein ACYCX5_05785 [Coriobacteriia bacterium]